MRFAAFLRAINVGGHVVKMERLRDLFAELGFDDVRTVIASGNVLFSTSQRSPSRIERALEEALREALGYEVATFLRTRAELEAILAFDPIPLLPPPPKADGMLSVAFLKAPPPASAASLLDALRSPVDDFHVRGREAWWLRRTRDARSLVLGSKLEKALGAATVRNVSTVARIVREM
jgi:uncharacterized protein (DUF1697 family)